MRRSYVTPMFVVLYAAVTGALVIISIATLVLADLVAKEPREDAR